MTYPITPNPGIHIDPTAAVAQKAAVQNELKALEGLFSQLPGQILNSIVNSILKALGWGSTSSTTPGGMAADIEQALTQLYNYAYTAATNLSALITNAEGQTIADLIAWLNTAQQAATDIEDFLTTGNWADLSAAWQEIIQAIFGTASSAPLTSWIPAAWVAKLPQNSHAVANFPNSSSVMAGGGWSWDSTVSYSGSAGSALFAASGNLGALRGIVIPVQPNQVVTMSAVVEWSGVTAASGTSPFQLQIIPWTATVEAGLNVPGAAGTPQNLASITSPASSASWTTLSGTYTVPSTGVGFVQVRLVVTADATAGSVWWNNCITTVSGGYLDTLENDLNTLQSDATASTEAFSTLLSSVESAITGYTNWSTFISAVESAWNTYTTTESNLLSSEIFTIQNFFSTLLGLNSSTGLISPGNISSGTGLSTLQADWNQWVSNIEAGWNALWGVTTTPASSTPILPAAVPNISAGTGNGQSADLLTHLTNVASVTGSSGMTPIGAALNSLTTITNTLSSLGSKVSGITIGQGTGGQTFQVIFSNYPSGPFSAAPFTTTYTGSGTGHLVLANGNATWSGANNGDVSVVGIFNNGGSGQAYTDTDYQELQASLAAYPNGAGSINYALLRCNSTGTDYVYGCIYLSSSFTLNWQLGCVVGGTAYTWASGTNAPLNLSFTLIAGVGTNPNRYQGVSGDTVVFDHVNTSSDPGGVFPVGSTHRYWGFRSDTYNSGQVYPAPAYYVGCSDNSPAIVPGSGIRQYCSSSGSATAGSSANSFISIGTSFFDTTANVSSDITPASGTGAIAGCTVTKSGRYLFEMRVAMTFATSVSMETICPAIQRFNSSNSLVETRLCTALGAAFNVVGAQAYTSHFGGSCVLTMSAGDYIEVGYYIDGPGSPSSLTFTGDAAGAQSWWDLTLIS